MSPDAPIESPCVSVCRLRRGDTVCEGCLRTTEEIASWTRFTPARRRAVMADLPRRRAARENEKPPGGKPDAL